MRGYPSSLVASLEAQGFTREEASSDLGHQGHDGALASLEVQEFTGEGAASPELGHRGYEGTIASLVTQAFTGEGEVSMEQGRRRRDGIVNNLINDGVDPEKASSELMICVHSNREKADTCKFLGGCNKAIKSGEFCIDHKPIKDEKSDWCGCCGRLLGGEVRVRTGVCYPCYKKPEATAARKKATAEKKAARGTCYTPGCKGVNNRGRDKCYTCSNPNKSK